MEPQGKPTENRDADEQPSAQQPLESASSASSSPQTGGELEIHPLSPHVGQATDERSEDEETDDDESDVDSDDSADESIAEDEQDSDDQPQPSPRALEPMQLESFLETWPRRRVPRSALKRAADDVTEQWGEIKRACLPREPVGSLADDAEERRVLGRLIVERTHVRMVRGDDGDGVPRVYLPGSSVPVTPVESLLKPLRRLLRAASAARARERAEPRGPDGADGEQSPEGMLRTIESLLDVILRQLPILQRKVYLVRDRMAEIGLPIVPKPANAG